MQLERPTQATPRKGLSQSPATGGQRHRRHPLEADHQLIAKVDALKVNIFMAVAPSLKGFRLELSKRVLMWIPMISQVLIAVR